MNLQNLTLFAAAGSLVAFWNQIKGFVLKLSSIVVKTDEIDSFLTLPFLQEILPHTKLIQWGNSSYITEIHYFPDKKVNENLIFSHFESYPALYRKIPILLSESGAHGLKITYLSGTFPIKKILEKVNQNQWQKTLENSKLKFSNFHIEEVSGDDKQYQKSGSSNGSISTSPAAPPLEAQKGIFSRAHTLADYGNYIGLKFSETQKKIDIKEEKTYFWSAAAKKLDSEISFWMENRSWYRDRNLSWRRGAMLYGPAGSGKTKMVLECAKKHGLYVLKLNVANMSNSEFLDAFSREKSNGQIVLIEDIDSVFLQRKNILADSTHTKQLLSFDTFINAIGGIKTANGSFVIITSNHPENLDPAMVRSGRIDAHIEVGYLCENGRRFVAENILRDWPNLVNQLVCEGDGLVAAEFENRCIELAIQEKNKELA